MGARRMNRDQIDQIVRHAWVEGAWTLSEFVEDTSLPERTIEESCIRLLRAKRINFDPPKS